MRAWQTLAPTLSTVAFTATANWIDDVDFDFLHFANIIGCDVGYGPVSGRKAASMLLDVVHRRLQQSQISRVGDMR
jgi:hypothetical protein